MADDVAQTVRIDRWLWAARFFKTRSLAAEAVSGGKVHVNDCRVKPAKPLAVGDELSICRGVERMVVVVRGLSQRRGSAKIAELLYEETQASRQRREREQELRRLSSAQLSVSPGRPDKKSRRDIRRLIGKA